MRYGFANSMKEDKEIQNRLHFNIYQSFEGQTLLRKNYVGKKSPAKFKFAIIFPSLVMLIEGSCDIRIVFFAPDFEIVIVSHLLKPHKVLDSSITPEKYLINTTVVVCAQPLGLVNLLIFCLLGAFVPLIK